MTENLEVAKNTGSFTFNRKLTNMLDPMLTQQFTVTFKDVNGNTRVFTDNALGLMGFIRPDDEIVSLVRA